MSLKFIATKSAVTTAVLAWALAAPQTALAKGAAEPLVLKPSSPWNVDFGAERCRLMRIFGEGENKHIMFMDQWSPSSSTGLTVSGPAFKNFRFRRGTRVYFFEGQEPLKTKPLDGDIPEFGNALIYGGINIETGDGSQKEDAEADGAGEENRGVAFLDTEFAAKTAYMHFQQGKRQVRLDAGPLGDAFKVLNQCTGQFLNDWGLDLDAHKTMIRTPKWANQSAIARRIQDTYPSTALRKGQSAIFRMRVIVGEDGKVEQCFLYKTTVADSLESPACKEMNGAKFDPALDANGDPMRSYYVTSITYSLG